VREQLCSALKGLSSKLLKNLIVAYEPVWAISANRGAVADSPESAFEMSVFIRRTLLDAAGAGIARSAPVLYGGSVSPKNAAAFLSEGGIGGLLVGSKSLNPKDFKKILAAAEGV